MERICLLIIRSAWSYNSQHSKRPQYCTRLILKIWTLAPGIAVVVSRFWGAKISGVPVLELVSQR